MGTRTKGWGEANYWLIVDYWRQYFFAEFQSLPPETIGGSTPGESHCTVCNCQKTIYLRGKLAS